MQKMQEQIKKLFFMACVIEFGLNSIKVFLLTFFILCPCEGYKLESEFKKVFYI